MGLKRILGHLLPSVIIAGSLTACFPPPPPLPPPEEIVKALSAGILRPETTCAELRSDFGLTDLPDVEYPDEVGIEYHEFFVPVGTDAQLRVWYMPVPEPRGVVVVAPGNSGPMSCYLFTAFLLTQHHYSVVAFDYRGFGGSTGEPTLENLRSDLEAVTEWAVETTSVPRVTLFGISLGSIASVAVAVDRPELVNGVILDSPVDIGSEIERFRFMVAGRSREIIAALTNWPWLLTEDIIAQVQVPQLILVHERDLVSPPRTVQGLVNRAGPDAQVILFAGLGHAAAQFLRTEEYTQHIVSFLESLD